ncbi:dehydrogenase [Loigolactobacillus backii]|uniref:FAD-binding oxidoreductase n=1 Tax=Loigolactobacillus backii TaxID=375175 RepID=UPI000C1CBA01|nr:FAD-binding oxidoreductase [Loigolactobacillus backii]PIO82604.1 dehydrogenase [Loigolactobacillus backii]
MAYNKVTEVDVAALTKIVGADRVIYPATVHYDHDQMKSVRSLPDVAVQPINDDEVAKIMAYANEHTIPVTVRGNATGLMGANVAIEHGIALDMIKMNQVLEYDPENLTITVQNGLRIRDINEYLADKPFIYVPAPAMKWATIGGNASTNAGGMRAVKYGTTRDYVRGIKVILADGTSLQLGGKTVKNSSGYDLKDLIVGSEGTLAVITELVLRLIPRPVITIDVLLPFDSVETAIKVVPKFLEAGIVPTGIEFFGSREIGYWEKYAEKQFVDHSGGGYLLLTFDGSNKDAVQADYERALEIAKNAGAKAPVLMNTADQAALVWEARNQLLTAIQATTPAMDEVDIVVPRSKIAAVLEQVHQIEETDQVRMPNFGHAGDGNLHIYICQDNYSAADFAVKVDIVIRKLYQVAKNIGGEMSGEHGIGYAREPYFAAFYGADRVALLDRIKDAFDPKHILNPDKVFPVKGETDRPNRPLELKN